MGRVLKLILLILLLSYPALGQTTVPYDFWNEKQLTGDWLGFRKELSNIGISMELSYQQHYQQNFKGGLNTHNAQKLFGTYDWTLQFNLGKMGLIPQSEDYQAGIYIKAKGSYNSSVQEYTGSRYNPNADPAGEDKTIYLNKWWLWQKFYKKIELRLGVLETVKDLVDVGLYANHEDRDFVNRASYRNVTIPHITGMGAMLKLDPTDWFYLQTVAVDAQAKQFENQFESSFHREDWFIGFWEMGFTPKWQSVKGGMPGKYRAGFWYNPTVRETFLNEEEEPDQQGHEIGWYIGLDQLIWKENDKDLQGLGVFSRIGAAEDSISRDSFYWQTGLSYLGLFKGRDADVLGFAVSQGIISKQYRNEIDDRSDRETVYEWYYSYQLTPAISISPDFQVITNPGGSKDGQDAIVGGIRIRAVF